MKYRLILVALCGYLMTVAQQKIHIKKQDNRFLFYQLGKHNDTITAHKNDLFLIKLPDSLKKYLSIQIENGQFRAVNKDSMIYQLQFIKGMKYSHQYTDSVFSTQLEGNCQPSKKITVQFYNELIRKTVFRNLFWEK